MDCRAPAKAGHPAARRRWWRLCRFTYKFELAPVAESDDEIAETNGVKLVVDPVSLDLVKGSAVDFVEDLGGAAFKVTNPNAQSGCGCGSSFSV